MKLGNKLSFGFTAVQAGQKNTTLNAEPQLIANSTSGKFTVTSPVSKALGVAVGENIMFINNIPNVEQAIQARTNDVIEYAQQNGIDLNTREGEDKVLADFTMWFIAKGVKKYDKTGAPVLASERFSKADKERYLEANRDAIVAENREALVAEFGDLTDEELAAKLTVDMVESPKYHAAEGSKTSTTSNATGIGCQLGFTDSAIWTALKADLGEDATKRNRIFDVITKDTNLGTEQDPDWIAPVTVDYNNGFENVTVMAYPILFKEDVAPIVREKKVEE